MYRDLNFTMFSQILVISCRQNSVSGLCLSINLEEIHSFLSMFIESGMFKVAISFRHFSSFSGDFSHCYIEMHPQVCKRSLHDARVLCLTWVIDRTSITLFNYYFTYKINNFSLQKSYCNSESCVYSFSRSIVP